MGRLRIYAVIKLSRSDQKFRRLSDWKHASRRRELAKFERYMRRSRVAERTMTRDRTEMQAKLVAEECPILWHSSSSSSGSCRGELATRSVWSSSPLLRIVSVMTGVSSILVSTGRAVANVARAVRIAAMNFMIGSRMSVIIDVSRMLMIDRWSNVGQDRHLYALGAQTCNVCLPDRMLVSFIDR